MRHTLLALFFLLTAPAAPAQLLINEVMQSNVDCLMDDLNEFPDSWIELYNAGSSAIDLSAYCLSTDSLASEAWTLPRQTIAAHECFVVYADKANTGRHAPFRLDTGKDATLFLFNAADGSIADRLHIAKKQPCPNIAYGRLTDGSDVWGYLVQPTPGTSNCGRAAAGILAPPLFSLPGQVFTRSQKLTLTLTLPEGAPEGATIHYTTDGSEPTANSTSYSQAITIRNTSVIRAKTFCEGYISAPSATQSYLFLGREMTLPVISIVTNKNYFYDKKLGIYVDGSYSSKMKNYEFNWRRPINLEYFEQPESPSLLNQLCETRIQGGASRGAKYKSLALYAHKRFGEKHFRHEFFPDQRPGQDRYKSLILRNAGNDFDYLYMRDAIMQRTMASHADLDWQAWRPAIIFINGEYTGMLNIRERSNEDNIYTNYDGLEDIDVIENWGDLKQGTWENFGAFTAFYNEHGHTWDEYAELMDLGEYLNLMVMNLYYNNQDFPGNNIVMWRPREEGGRWRFIAKDTDFGMGLYGHPYNYETFRWIYDNNYDYDRSWANRPEDTRLFRRLMEDEQFKRAFIDRCAIYMGSFLNYSGTWEVWQPMYELIKTEYPNHRRLINQWWPNYSDELSMAQNWLKQRTTSFYNQLGSYFSQGSPVSVYINTPHSAEERAQIDVSFNGCHLPNALFEGKFFVGHEITLRGGPALDADGLPLSSRTVTGWTVQCGGQTYQYQGPECHFTVPQSSVVVIYAQLGDDDGIEQIMDDKPASHRYYDLMGRRVNQPRGIVIESWRK